MAVIEDLVLTFCPTMHSVQQKKLKLLMPVFNGKPARRLSKNDTKLWLTKVKSSPQKDNVANNDVSGPGYQILKA